MQTTTHSVVSQMKRFVTLGLLASGLLIAGLTTQAGDRVPFKAACAGYLVPLGQGQGFYVIEAGVATHLGKHTEIGPQNELVMTAANKDQLFTHLKSAAFVPGGLEVHIVIDDGTGRFAGATGEYVVMMTVDFTTGAFTGEATGWISSVGSNKK
jgi:hypothetical protein